MPLVQWLKNAIGLFAVVQVASSFAGDNGPFDRGRPELPI
jgi:hypothetical protein